MKSVFNNISVDHFLIRLLYFHYLLFDFAFKDQIEILVRINDLLSSHILFLLQTFVQKHLKSRKLQNGCICVLVSKVGVIYWVTCLCTCQSSCVSTVILNSLNQGNEVSFWFGHLLTIYINVSVAVIGLGPHGWIVPNSSMIVKSHSQVIFNKVFSRASEVHGIPIQKWLSQLLKFEYGDFLCMILLTQQDIIPKVSGYVFWLYTQNSNFASVNVPLQQVGNRIKSKVNCRVWKRFDQVLFIKRQFCS